MKFIIFLKITSAVGTEFKHVGKERYNCSMSEAATSDLSLLAEKKVAGTGTGCVELPSATLGLFGGVDYMTVVRRIKRAIGLGPDVPNRGQRVVWVSGYPRSGSSTVLSMVSATVDDNRAAGQTFSLFEPCHDGDVLAKWKAQAGCSSLLYGLTRCDFAGIKKLWGWADPHSTNNYTTFSSLAAHDVCAAADVVAFKTVDYGHELSSWKWLLDSHPNMRIIDVVRDPRGIYASWKVLEPFASLVKTGKFYTLVEICDHFEKNIEYKDDRIHRVLFEDLLSFPYRTTRNVYKFLGETYGEEQEAWVQNAFNNKHCPPPKPGMEGFTDCHTNSTAVKDKWRTVLKQSELDAFTKSKSCTKIAKYYGYPLH